MKKLFTLFLCLVMLFAITIPTGCQTKPYNAKLYSKCNQWVQSQFLEEHKVSGYYWDDNGKCEYYDGPSSMTFIISDQETFNEVFVTGLFDVDFNKETVYLYIFTCYSKRYYYLDNVTIQDETVIIDYILEYIPGIDDGVMPFQRCLIVKMDKTDTAKVKFVQTYKEL